METGSQLTKEFINALYEFELLRINYRRALEEMKKEYLEPNKK